MLFSSLFRNKGRSDTRGIFLAFVVLLITIINLMNAIAILW